jgi:hypothetical protein
MMHTIYGSALFLIEGALKNVDFRTKSGKRRLRGMRKILPQAYSWYPKDKSLRITPSLGEKTIFQGTLELLSL